MGKTKRRIAKERICQRHPPGAQHNTVVGCTTTSEKEENTAEKRSINAGILDIAKTAVISSDSCDTVPFSYYYYYYWTMANMACRIESVREVVVHLGFRLCPVLFMFLSMIQLVQVETALVSLILWRRVVDPRVVVTVGLIGVGAYVALTLMAGGTMMLYKFYKTTAAGIPQDDITRFRRMREFMPFSFVVSVFLTSLAVTIR